MKLVFATHNIHKLKEIQALLPQTIELLSLSDIGCNEEIAETAATIEGNALLKAQYVKKHYHYDVFADDTGLEVEALDNAPGVYSARYAGEEKNNEANISLLLKNMEGKGERQARFKTVFALCIGQQHYSFEGIAQGEITQERRGEGGFGYDAVFLPKGEKLTFAQMTPQEKNNISHRGKALDKLVAFFQKREL